MGRGGVAKVDRGQGRRGTCRWGGGGRLGTPERHEPKTATT